MYYARVHDYSKFLKEVLEEEQILARWMPEQELLQLKRRKLAKKYDPMKPKIRLLSEYYRI